MRITLGNYYLNSAAGIKQSLSAAKTSSKMFLSYGRRQHVYKANHRQKARELNGRHKRDAKIGLGLGLELWLEPLEWPQVSWKGCSTRCSQTVRKRGDRERREGPVRCEHHSLNINNIFIYFVCRHFGIFECIYFNILKRTFCKTFCLHPAMLLLLMLLLLLLLVFPLLQLRSSARRDLQ